MTLDFKLSVTPLLSIYLSPLSLVFGFDHKSLRFLEKVDCRHEEQHTFQNASFQFSNFISFQCFILLLFWPCRVPSSELWILSLTMRTNRPNRCERCKPNYLKLTVGDETWQQHDFYFSHVPPVIEKVTRMVFLNE